MKDSDAVKHESLLTWCHCTPTETPSRLLAFAVGMENNFHSVPTGSYRWRLEVKRRIRIWDRGEAAAVVQERCPIPIGNLDKVTRTGGDIFANPDVKAVELQHQYLSFLHFYDFCSVDVVRVVARVVW